mmetsp:Transcript_14538/g.22087  ORF Transcript_14538/g.22087 Transcript_14538/m.22087 type:complete len:89 (-) Transcript_14538:477-743(-)
MSHMHSQTRWPLARGPPPAEGRFEATPPNQMMTIQERGSIGKAAGGSSRVIKEKRRKDRRKCRPAKLASPAVGSIELQLKESSQREAL